MCTVYGSYIVIEDLDDTLFHREDMIPKMSSIGNYSQNTVHKLHQRAHNLTLPVDINATTKN